MNTKPATLAAAGTVLLWASAFPAITVAVRGLGPAGLAVARLAVASAALAVVAPVLGVRRPRPRDLPLIALCGLAGMTGYQLLLNAGERVVSAGTASLLVATAPVYASLLAVAFLGEHATRRRWAGSAVALAGTALIAASHGLGFGTSALIVLAAAVLQAIFHTAQKPLLARYTGFEVTAYAMWAGTVFILPWTGSLLRALWGPGRTRAGRPSARRSSSAWRRPRPGSCCGPTPWRGRTSGGSPSACTWCRPPRSGSRWSGWARSPGRPS